MKNIFKNLTIVAALAISCSSFAEVSVIVHPSNSASIDKDAVSRIFLGRIKDFNGGGDAVPISQEDGSPVRAEFNSHIIRKSDSQLKSYWSKLVFTGKGTPPKKVVSDKEVINLISKNPAMIGYVNSESVDPSVKVVLTF
mgnify:CR=1 FL=1|jgi:ABC-type phosphate transport system substrate-binding protein